MYFFLLIYCEIRHKSEIIYDHIQIRKRQNEYSLIHSKRVTLFIKSSDSTRKKNAHAKKPTYLKRFVIISY